MVYGTGGVKIEQHLESTAIPSVWTCVSAWAFERRREEEKTNINLIINIVPLEIKSNGSGYVRKPIFYACDTINRYTSITFCWEERCRSEPYDERQLYDDEGRFERETVQGNKQKAESRGVEQFKCVKSVYRQSNEG